MSATTATLGSGTLPAVGAIVWLVGVAVTLPGWAPTLLLLAPFVLFPLGLDLIADEPARRLPRGFLLLCALPLLASFALERGQLAAALAAPWLMLMMGLACEGVWRLAHAPRRPAREWGIAAALVFPSVGAGWLVISRLGLRPLDLSDPIVQATAMHFHYAGFALPLIAALLAGRTWVGAVGVAGVLLGVPLVAAGITFAALGFRYLEAPAAWFLACVCLLVAFLQWREVRRDEGWSRGLSIASSLALTASMSLAATYALGQLIDMKWLDVPWMVRTHGTLNAVGFALLGLLGWRLRGGATSRS